MLRFRFPPLVSLFLHRITSSSAAGVQVLTTKTFLSAGNHSCRAPSALAVLQRNAVCVRNCHQVSTAFQAQPNELGGDTRERLTYPPARRDASVEYEYFGVKIKDPYRWLENPDSEETKRFVDAQNAVSIPYLNGCPAKKKIQEDLSEMWDYPKYSVPFREGNRYFYFMNSGVQNQSVLYTQEGLHGPATVFFDPNQLSRDGTVSLNAYQFSEDGETFAYALSEAGSDWVTIRFKDVSSGKDYPEILRRVKFSCMEWTHDHKGIFYCKYPETDMKADGTETDAVQNQKLYYHRLNSDPSEDVLVVEFPEHPKWMMYCKVSHCGRYLFIYVSQECRDNLVFVADLEQKAKNGIKEKLDLTPVFTRFEADFSYVTNNGPKALFRTNKDAPNYRLVEIDVSNADETNWRTFVEAHETDVLDWATAVNNDKLVLCYMRDVKSVLQLHDLNTGAKIQDFPLEVGNVVSYSSKRTQNEMYYKFDSYLIPGTIYRIDFSKEGKPYESEVFRTTEVKGFNKDDFVTKQVFYTSKDGTRIPMFVIHGKDLPRDGTAPALLYGYGGFNISIKPKFSLVYLNFIKAFRGVVAEANIRGGGEYGERWHNEGRLLKKQNVFDDFQSAAEYLIAEKYTQSSKLTIEGHSNGGFLVGACLNQRPDLFGAGIAGVGVMDLMRFHKFTIGYAWTSDYGNPETNEEHFKNLLKLSPLHNVPSVASFPDGVEEYPSLLLLTADHDDRVVPLHSLKFIAELQHRYRNNGNQKNPIIIRLDTNAGHGQGKPTKKRIEEIADTFAFIMRSLKLQYFGNS